MYNARPLLVLLVIVIILFVLRYVMKANNISEYFSSTLVYPTMFDMNLTDTQAFMYDNKKYILEYLRLDELTFAINREEPKMPQEVQNFTLYMKKPNSLKVFIQPITYKGEKILQCNILSNGILQKKINIHPQLPFTDNDCIKVLYSYNDSLPEKLSSECKWIPSKKHKSKCDCVKDCIIEGEKNNCSGSDCLYKCHGCKSPHLCSWLSDKSDKISCSNFIPKGNSLNECLQNCKTNTDCPNFECVAMCKSCPIIDPANCPWKNKCEKYTLNQNQHILDQNFNNLKKALAAQRSKNLKFMEKYSDSK